MKIVHKTPPFLYISSQIHCQQRSKKHILIPKILRFAQNDMFYYFNKNSTINYLEYNEVSCKWTLLFHIIDRDAANHVNLKAP